MNNDQKKNTVSNKHPDDKKANICKYYYNRNMKPTQKNPNAKVALSDSITCPKTIFPYSAK